MCKAKNSLWLSNTSFDCLVQKESTKVITELRSTRHMIYLRLQELQSNIAINCLKKKKKENRTYQSHNKGKALLLPPFSHRVCSKRVSSCCSARTWHRGARRGSAPRTAFARASLQAQPGARGAAPPRRGGRLAGLCSSRGAQNKSKLVCLPCRSFNTRLHILIQ